MCRYTGTAQATVVTKINLKKKKIKTNVNNFVNLENKIKQDFKKQE